MRQILVAVDESEASSAVADFVNRFFGGLDVEVAALNVGTAPPVWAPHAAPGLLYPWGYPLAARRAGDFAETSQSVDVDAQREQGVRAVDATGLERHTDVVDLGAGVADTIRRVAVDRGAEMIVVGHNDKGLLERLLSPSVSSDLAKESPVPVLVVQAPAAQRAR